MKHPNPLTLLGQPMYDSNLRPIRLDSASYALHSHSAVNQTIKKTKSIDLVLLGSPGRIRTYDLSVNSRALHH